MRRICFGITFFFIGSFCKAQDTTRMSIGMEAGPSMAYIIGLQDTNTYFRPMASYTIGINFQYNFNSFFSIRTGMQYDVKGIEEKLLVVTQPYTFYADSLTDHSAYNQLQYIQIPLMARLTFGKKVFFTIDAGIYLGFLLSAYNITPGVVLDGLGNIQEYNEQYFWKKNIMSNFNRIDAGGILGIGIGYNVHPKLRLSFSVRENLGFHHIGRFEPSSTYFISNSSTQFLLGLSWNFYSKKYPVKAQ